MKVTILISFLFLSVIPACTDVKVAPTGHDDEILVFADDSTWDMLRPSILGAFQDTVRTPQPEVNHQVKRIPYDDFLQYETHLNRIVVAPLNGAGPVGDFVRRSLDPSVQKLVLDGKEFVFNKYDSKARGQLLMFLTARNLQSLQSAIVSTSEDIGYYFKSMSLKRELAGLRSEVTYQKHDIERYLLDRNGWTITVQHDYFIPVDTTEERFFWMRRATPSDMERWIFVAWMDVSNPEILTDRSVISLRDSITRKWLRTVTDDAAVEIAPYNLEVQNVNFLGRFAYEMRGNWRFSDKTGGGPFVNYTFYDEATRRIYVADGSIFAPRVEKKKLIIQVDAILHTFKTAGDITEADRERMEY